MSVLGRCLMAWIVALGALSLEASAQEDPGARGVPRASEVLRSMADHLAAAKHFRFHAEINYDKLASWGQKIQFAGAAEFAWGSPVGLPEGVIEAPDAAIARSR